MGEIIEILPTPIVNLKEARRKKLSKETLVLGEPIPRISEFDPQFAPVIERVSHRGIPSESVLIKRAERKRNVPPRLRLLK